MRVRSALPDAPACVITPTRGLMSPDTLVTVPLLQEFATEDVDADASRYRRALEVDAAELADRLTAGTDIVLLGSVATGKYVDVLEPFFGGRLYFPADFVGRGDMSRGGLMLRSSRSGIELPYTAIAPGQRPRGPRPPRLDALPSGRPHPPSRQPRPGRRRKTAADSA
jgi:hypothetical protein